MGGRCGSLPDVFMLAAMMGNLDLANRKAGEAISPFF
jgi:hypothetical protein